jgi:formylglycine-generating enzyme required for sulfatase activity
MSASSSVTLSREHFVQLINDCDIVLVIVGPDWARIMQERAHEPDDRVRVEGEIALGSGKPIILVTVTGASLPRPGELPKSIRRLCWHNAFRVLPSIFFRKDCQKLADGISEELSVWNKSSAANASSRPSPDILPQPFAWIDIPGGEVTLEAGGYVPEGGKTFTMEPFAIAKYPVTNAQFRVFWEASGYDNDAWWTDEGWALRKKAGWTEPRYWQDEKWNQPDHPVVGVSWFEAVAFCLWLNAQIYGVSRQLNIMLPTEQQWQRAAQGDDGRAYPWGSKWDPNRCNSNVGRIRVDRTTPVTQLEGINKGDSLFGVVDMVGNVWEWCCTNYETGAQGFSIPANERTLRGGSWDMGKATFFRCGYRNGANPDLRNYLIGFRVSGTQYCDC